MINYLEISPRQSGKTSRLVQSAESWLLNNGGVVNVVTPNPNYILQFFGGKAQGLIGERLFLTSVEVSKLKITKKALPVRYYYDEFDALGHGVTIRFDAYYSTSIRRTRSLGYILQWGEGKRSDILLSLLSLNNYGILTFNEGMGGLIEISGLPFPTKQQNPNNPLGKIAEEI